MSEFIIPVTPEMVEDVAKAIARDRLVRDAQRSMVDAGLPPDVVKMMDGTVERVFERLWAGSTELDDTQRRDYLDDARAAIGAINLKLLLLQ